VAHGQRAASGALALRPRLAGEAEAGGVGLGAVLPGSGLVRLLLVRADERGTAAGSQRRGAVAVGARGASAWERPIPPQRTHADKRPGRVPTKRGGGGGGLFGSVGRESGRRSQRRACAASSAAVDWGKERQRLPGGPLRTHAGADPRVGLTGPAHEGKKGFDFSEIDFQSTQKSK
jgi:hypothetical protein